MKISCRRKSQLVVSYQVVTDPCCGLSVIFCGFISHLIGRETINIPEIFSGIHGFTGKTVILSDGGSPGQTPTSDLIESTEKVFHQASLISLRSRIVYKYSLSYPLCSHFLFVPFLTTESIKRLLLI